METKYCILILILVFSCGETKKSYYDTGELRGETEIENNLNHGVLKNYYKNGAIESVGHWNYGVQDGELTHYYLSGGVESISFYVDGKLNGQVNTYYEDSSLKSSTEYVEGQRSGLDLFFYRNGTLKERKILSKDKLAFLQSYSKDGVMEFNSVLPLIEIPRDSLFLGDTWTMKLSFGVDLTGELNIEVGTFKEPHFDIDTTLVGIPENQVFKYELVANKIGKNEFYFNVSHRPNVGDSLNANDVMKKVSFWVFAESS